MPLPFAAGAVGGATQTIMAMVRFRSNGGAVLGGLLRWLVSLRSQFLTLGVTTIFLDRLVQSLTRSWKLLTETLGAGRVARTAMEIRRMSEFTGIGVERLQAFSVAAQNLGMDLNDVSDLFQTLTERIDDLRNPDEKGIIEDFAHFGLTARDFAGTKGSLEQFAVFAEALSKLPDEKRMAAAEKLLGGDNARKNSFFLAGGAASIQAAMQAAIDSGAVMSKQQVQQASRFRQSQERLLQVMTGLQNNVALIFIPALRFLAEMFTVIAKRVSRLVRGQIVRWSQMLLLQIVKIGQGIMGIVNMIDQQIMPFEEFIARLTQGFLGLSAAMSFIVVGPFVAKLAGLLGLLIFMAKVVEDIFVFMRGGQSLIEKLLQDSELVKQVWHDSQGVFLALILLLEQAKALFLEVLSSRLFWEALQKIMELLGGALVLMAGLIAITRVLWSWTDSLLERWIAFKMVLFTIARLFETIARIMLGKGSLLDLQKLDTLGNTAIPKSLRTIFSPEGLVPGGTSQSFRDYAGPSLQRLFAAPPGQQTTQNATFNLNVANGDPAQLANLAFLGPGVLANMLEGN